MWVPLAVLGPSSLSQDDRVADERALARMARGDRDALAELYDRHVRLIFSLALRILQDRAEAEDVVQDVFTQAWTQAARYDTGRGAVAAWMLMLTRSRAIDHLRSKQAGAERPVDLKDAANIPDTAMPQDMQLLSTEQIAQVRKALAELPLAQRTALELAYYEGLTHSEIAKRLDEPLGTVKTRIRQAVIKLRESLTGTI
jgi:RNA polymerase sigma-70 factor (ECF subfamily)